MIRFFCKPLALALFLAPLFAVATSWPADLPGSASVEFRSGNYSESIRLASKADPAPRRDFLIAVALLRAGKPEEALPRLIDSEKALPLAADYAASYQAEALFGIGRFSEAAEKALIVARQYPSSLLLRRNEKLLIDALFRSGDFNGALKSARNFIEKYPSGTDSVDALFLTGGCMEKIGDVKGAAWIYRNIWLNNPASAQAAKSGERLKEIGASAAAAPYTANELLQRASALSALNHPTATLQTLDSIQKESVTAETSDRITFQRGIALYRLKKYLEAEKYFRSLAGDSRNPSIKSEGSFYLAKTLERKGSDDEALKIYMELAAGGKSEQYADDALMEAAGLLRNRGDFAGGARLYAKLVSEFPESRFAPKATWGAAWSNFLAGRDMEASEAFKKLLNDYSEREKALYWLARSLEKSGSSESQDYYDLLLSEYPGGFYAAWIRDRKGVPDNRETVGKANPLTEIPDAVGFEKPRLLASIGMLKEARDETAAILKRIRDQKAFAPALAKLYLETGDYGSSILLFHKNRPLKWETKTLPLWVAGFPVAHSDKVSRYAGENGLQDSLVYSIIRNESGFSEWVKISGRSCRADAAYAIYRAADGDGQKRIRPADAS